MLQTANPTPPPAESFKHADWKMMEFYRRRCSGEAVSQEAGAVSMNIAYILEKTGLKKTQSSGRIRSNQWVRMRSPVQIWLAAPQTTLKVLLSGGFFVYAYSNASKCCAANECVLFDPHPNPYGENSRKCQREAFRFFSGTLFLFCFFT